MPTIGASPTCWLSRMSPIGTRPSRTARSIFGPLNPSDPPGWMLILTRPSVAFSTSAAKIFEFSTWKLPSGQASGRSYSAAESCVVPRLSSAAMAAVGTMRCMKLIAGSSCCVGIGVAPAAPRSRPDGCRGAVGCQNCRTPRHAVRNPGLRYTRFPGSGGQGTPAPRDGTELRGVTIRPAVRPTDRFRPERGLPRLAARRSGPP